MLRRCVLLALGVVGFSFMAPWASAQSLLSHPEAARNGLKRAWYTQVELDRSQDKLVGFHQDNGTIFLVTNRGTLHSIDSETGKTNWVSQIGHETRTSLGPAANEKYVAILNGTRLYVVERATGKPVWDRFVGGGPGAGPTMSKTKVWVPLINGRVEAYDLEDTKKPGWNYTSFGRILNSPLFTGDSMCWPTDQGYLYVARPENAAVRFRVETRGEVVTQPAYIAPYIYAVSRDGYVYAVHELTGAQKWRFAAGAPISEAPVAVKDRVYICPDRTGLYAIDAETGLEVWSAPQIARVLSVTPDRIFGADQLGNVMILDAKTGARLGQFSLPDANYMLTNNATDRIYIGAESGLLQCIHDINIDKPIVYFTPKSTSDNETKESKAKKAGGKKAAEGEDGDAAEDQPADDDAKPDGDEPAMEEDNGGTPFDADPPAKEEPPAGGADDNPFAAPADEKPAAPADGDAKPEMKDEKPAEDDNPFS